MLHVRGGLDALVGIGGVDVEEDGVAAERLDLAHDPLDVAERRLAVEVDAEDVQARPRQRQAGGLAEAGRRTQRQGPAAQTDQLVSFPWTTAF